MARVTDKKGNGLEARIDIYSKNELVRSVRSNSQGFFHFINSRKINYNLKIFSMNYKNLITKIKSKKGELATFEMVLKPTPPKNQQ